MARRTASSRSPCPTSGQIPKEILPVIFDPFRGRSEPGHRTEGLGLGLYIVRQIAEAHGGRVDVASNPGERTRFTVQVAPAREADRAACRCEGRPCR